MYCTIPQYIPKPEIFFENGISKDVTDDMTSKIGQGPCVYSAIDVQTVKPIK